MKNYLIIIAVLFVGIISSCNKDEISEPNDLIQSEFEFTGVILGHDLTFCPCCGGLIIDIEGDDKNYRGILPEDSDIEIKDTAVPVKLNFTIDSECGGLTLITIDDIELN